MRIFVAGATGAIGRRLVPLLVAAGHDVTATTRTPAKVQSLRASGAEPVVVDGLDADAVTDAVTSAKPEIVMHQLTALSGPPNLRRFDDYFAETSRLRTEGTDNLLRAARAAGTRRVLVQSYAGWSSERSGSPVKTETDPLDPHPTAASRRTVAAQRYLESTVTAATDIEGVVLRYGGLYGPGTSVGEGGELLTMIRRRMLPIVGGGTGIWSFVHVDDAAAATVLAIDHGTSGLYNIVDDDPAPVAEWLPYLADAIGAPRPLRLPAWLARPLIGAHGISMMTVIRGASNAKARRELGWTPSYPSWRQGFAHGLA
ncbi:MAG TPA: NAD(P)-dependent oxidoreductase [Euzebyales bacterium]|nr:NAD(P)-dependent oxidoreductase [Euzebyales bacterium]